MQKISTEILDRIQDRCELYNYYRVCILCEHRERARQIQEALVNIWPAVGRQSGAGYFDVQFAAKHSFVRILTYGEVLTGSARGNRFHELYVDVDMHYIDAHIEAELNRMIVPFGRLDYRFTPYDFDTDPPVFRHLDTREFNWMDYERPPELETLEKIAASYNLDALAYTKRAEAPDLGEFTPCQELNSFLESLA